MTQDDNPNISEQLKHMQLTLSEFKKAFRKDADALFEMILKRERLWTVCANAKDREEQARAADTGSQGHEQELEAIQAKYEQIKVKLKKLPLAALLISCLHIRW